MSELLKCPFCGRRAELRHDKDGFSYIVCANDGCYVRTDGHLNEESAINQWNTRKSMANIVEKLEEKTEFLKDCTKYGNESSEQQEKSYSTMMMYEVADLVDDLIDIVKQEINNGLE